MANTDINTGMQFVADLLQEASGGRALQGIYFTGKLKDMLAEREKLLGVPKNITDAVARAQTMNSLSADVLEMELPELARKGFCVFMPTGGQMCEQGVRQASTLQRTELYFDEEDLCLSTDALSCLKNIANELNSLSEEEKIKLFAAFFERFGSHAIAGHIIIESYNLGGTSPQGQNKLRTVPPMDQNDIPILFVEHHSEGKKGDGQTTTLLIDKEEKGDSFDTFNETLIAQKSEHSKMSETVDKEECEKCKNTSDKNTENKFQCETDTENKFTKNKKTDNEKHEPIDDSSEYDRLDEEMIPTTISTALLSERETDNQTEEEELNTQESTSEALSVRKKSYYLVPVWTLIECGGEKEYFPNACQVAADLKRAYDVVCSQQPDKPIVEDAEKLTEMATSALSALQNAGEGRTPVGEISVMGLQNYLQAMTKETSPWLPLSTTSVTSLLSLLFLCSTPPACFVPNTENSYNTDEKRRTVSQVTVECCEEPVDMSDAATASNVILTAAASPVAVNKSYSKFSAAKASSTKADFKAAAPKDSAAKGKSKAAVAKASSTKADSKSAAAKTSAAKNNSKAAAAKDSAAKDKSKDAVAKTSAAKEGVAVAVDVQNPQQKNEMINNTKESIEDLMRRLGLKNYFPKRLDRSQFHAVRFGTTNGGDDHSVPPNKLVSHFIHMLRIADSNIRQLGYSEDTDDTESTAEGEGPVHPIDLLLCVFQCADDFMRQHMFLRLSAAQLALPFVIPMPHSAGLEMPLWSFRVVLKSVLSSTTSGEQRLCETSVCDAKFPIVCFVRYGQFSLSKSRYANKVLNDGRNVVFFDRECRNNVESRVLVDGLAEIYWYCPSGKKKDDRFDTFTAVVNMRGDALEHSQLAAYLHDIASVNVIFCTKATHERMDADITGKLKGKPLIWVSPDMNPSNEEQEKVIRCKNNYDASTVSKLRECIKRGLEAPIKKYSLIEFAEHGQQKHGIKVDDGCEVCLEAKTCVNDIMQLVNGVIPEKAKEALLPLSNNFFHSWCKADMESAHLKVGPGVGIEHRECEIERKKRNIRQKQAEEAQNSVFMNACIGKLRGLSSKGRLFFLRWLEIGLNARSSKCLAEIRAECTEVDNRIDQLKQSKESGALAHVETLTRELDDLSQKINASTFGLEHCLREVGQVYEAMRSQGCMDYNDLPRIAADLLKDGEPLELMDGDACHVPLDWVGAVLKELHEIVRGKKVFVLSVLGVQSSGKSTLLNTMFGLRFAVSAGRCTRGAFMQLVEIAEEHTEELGYDYVLVIDTEGLRSQEISGECSLKRDNKMASLVIGLANMTLINVTGENVSEIKDFLQIAVHAFLRIREVKLTPGCLFVHQNVSAPDAKDKNMEARRSLRRQLDEVTAEAARQEGFPVQCFGDVIKSDTISYYFSSLFTGDPPMASLNPSYGERACDVRNAILEGARGQSVLRISDFSTRVRDLWMALRGENFVFRFKNTLEMRVYRKLETKCSEFDRSMRHGFVNLSGKIRNKIQKGDLTTVSAKEIKGHADASQLLQRAKEACEIFFNDDEEKDALGQWRDKTMIHLENYFDECVEEAVRQAKNYIKTKECKNEVEKAVEKYEKEIIERTKELAQNNKGIVNEVEGRQLFNDMFEKYLEEVKKSTPEPCRADVEYDARASLRASFSDMPKMNSRVNQIGKNSKFVVNVSIHLTEYRKWYGSLTKFLDDTHAAELHVERTYEDLVQVVMAHINDQRGSEYSKGWFETIIGNVSNEVKRINTTPACKKFELHREFCFDALLHIFGFSITCFKEIHEDFVRINHPANLLSEKRDNLYQYFTTAYDNAVATVSIANNKSEKIMEAYRGRILDKVFSDVAKGTTLVPALNGNKSNLEAHVLKDMITRECFEDLIQYIRHPREYYKCFISCRVNEYCGTGELSRLHKVIKAAVEYYHEEVRKCMKESTKEVESTGENVDAWLEKLHGKISDNVPFTADDLKEAVTEEMQSDVECFQNGMLTAWGNIDKEYYTDNIYNKERKSIVDRVVKDVLKETCGCLERCPFCRAVCCCTLAGHDVDHSVLFHRPCAIGGMKWHKINEAVLDICSTLVKSECLFQFLCYSEEWFKYKVYRTAGPPFDTWSITPDDSSQTCWKWIVCRFSNELEAEYGYKFEGKGEIPSEWKKITKEEAIDSMN